jgi:hypothetical protein
LKIYYLVYILSNINYLHFFIINFYIYIHIIFIILIFKYKNLALCQIRERENYYESITDDNNTNNFILESKKTNYDFTENEDNFNFNNNNNENENIVLNQSVFDMNDNYNENENQNQNPKEKEKENLIKKTNKAKNNRFDSKSIFGELINEQEERIKKFSPYGKFKTWKICRIIGNLFIYLIY